MAHPYSFAFDGSSKSYLPILISARVKLWDPISLMLKPQFEVMDKDGFDWLKTGKLQIVAGSKKLIEAGRAAQFSLSIGPNLTIDDVFDSQGKTEILLTLYPDRGMTVPGTPVPINSLPVTSSCEIRVPLPAEIETDVDPFLALDKGGVYLSARVNLFLQYRDPELANKIRESITFTQRSGQIVIDQFGVKHDGDWKRVHVYPLPGNEHLVREQNNLVEVRATVLYENLSQVVVLPLDTQALELIVEPQPTLTLNSRDVVTARAVLHFSEAFPLAPVDRDALINSLSLQFDSQSSGWLTLSNKVTTADGAVWTIKGTAGSPRGTTSPPPQAQLQLTANWQGRSLSASSLLALVPDKSSMEIFANPSPPLVIGDEQGIWVYARVRESGSTSKAVADAATDSICFSRGGANASMLKILDEQRSGDYKAARIVGNPEARAALGPSLKNGLATVTASTAIAGSPLSETLDIPFERGFDLHVQVKNNSWATVKFDSQKKTWDLPPIKAWFAFSGESSAVKSSCVLESSPVKTRNDLLKVVKIGSVNPLEYEIFVDIDFKRKEFDQLLKDGGRLEVEVRGKSDDGKITYKAYITYVFIEEHELVVEQVGKDLPLEEPRVYKSPAGKEQKCKIQIGDIVSDGSDSIRLCLYSRRKDKQGDKGKSRIEEAQVDSAIVGTSIVGTDSCYFELKPDTTVSPTGKAADGKFYYLLKSKRPLLVSRARMTDKTIKLNFQLETSQKGSGKQAVAFDYRVKVLSLFTEFWIFPGFKRGRSVAAAFVCIESEKDGVVEGLECEIEISADAAREPKMKVEGNQKAKVDNKGLAYWEVSYGNLFFSNAAQAKFKVKCHPVDCPDSTYFLIDVEQNGKDFLKVMDERARLGRLAADSLDLTNEEFNAEGKWLYSADYVVPDDVRGALYNVRWLYYGDIPGLPVPLSRYTCGEIKKRLLDYGFSRRFKKDTCLSMNGIELGDYAVGYLHNFFGFNLSGNSIMRDAWFIDPWWRQRWDAEEVAHSWKTEYWKCVWAVIFILCELALVGMFIYVTGRAIGSYLKPGIDKLRTLVPDFSKYEYLQRLRAAIGRWLSGPEGKTSVNYETAVKVAKYGAALIGMIGTVIMLHPRVRLDSAYFEEDASYRPTTLYRERERAIFPELRACELVADAVVDKEVEPREAW